MPFELVIPIGQAARKTLLAFQREIIRRPQQLEYNNLVYAILEHEARSLTNDRSLSPELARIIKTVKDGLDKAVGTSRYQTLVDDLAAKYVKIPPYNPCTISAIEQQPMCNLHINLGIRIGDVSLAAQNRIKDIIRTLIVANLDFANHPIKFASPRNLYLETNKQTGLNTLEAFFDPDSELRIEKLRHKIVLALSKIANSDPAFSFTNLFHLDDWIPTVVLFKAVKEDVLFNAHDRKKSIVVPMSEFRLTHIEGLTKHVKEIKGTNNYQTEYESLFIAQLFHKPISQATNQHAIFATPKPNLIRELFGSTVAAQQKNALDF